MADAASETITLINALLGAGKTVFGTPGGTQSLSQSQTTSGGTRTEQTMLSQEAVNSLLRGLMEGTSGRPGLASIAGAQRLPGMYNTTSRTLLVNDLLARAAGEVAERSAPKVTTESPKTITTNQKTTGVGSQTGMVSSSTGLLGLAALGLGTKKGRKTISDLLGIGTDQFPTGGTDLASIAAQDAADFGVEGVQKLGEALGYVNSPITGMGIENAGDLATMITGGLDEVDFTSFADAGSLFDLTGGVDVASTFADAGSLFDLTGGVDAAATAFDFGGFPVLSSIGNLAQGDIGGLAGTGIGFALGGPVGAAIGNMFLGEGGIEGAVESVGSTLDTAFGALDDCFITTVVCRGLQKEDDCYELETLRAYRDGWLQANHPEEIRQYYAEAPEMATALAARADAPQLMHQLHRNYIMPAVVAIEQEKYGKAYTIYKNLFDTVKALTFSGDSAHGN